MMKDANPFLSGHLKQLHQWQKDQQTKLRQQQEQQMSYLREQREKMQLLLKLNEIEVQTPDANEDRRQHDDEIKLPQSSEKDLLQGDDNDNELSIIYEENASVFSESFTTNRLSSPINTDAVEAELEDSLKSAAMSPIRHARPNDDVECQKNSVDIDVQVIKSANKSFSQLLEEELQKSKKDVVQNQTHKIKRPFLKKGQGIARFNNNKSNDSTSNTKPEKMSFPNKAAANMLKIKDIEAMEGKEEFSTGQFAFKDLNISHESDSTSITESSFGIKLQEVKKKHKVELAELQEFEMLEEVANEPSFYSVSSDNENVVNNEMKNYHADENFQKSPSSGRDTTQEDIDETIVECNSDIDDASKMQYLSTDEEAKGFNFEFPALHDEDDDVVNEFNDEKSWHDDASLESVPQSPVIPYNSFKYSNGSSDDENSPSLPAPASNYISSIFTGLRRNENKAAKVSKEQVTSSIVQKASPGAMAADSLLQKRLAELEAEINTFKKENEKLQKLKKSKAQELEQQTKSRKDLEKAKLDLDDAKKKLETERKKFRREKQLFERRDNSKKQPEPTPLDSCNVDRLKSQIETLKDEMQAKEKQWNATASRHKSRINVLETSNKDLKRDLESCQTLQKNLRNQLQKKERQLADAVRTNRRLVNLTTKDGKSEEVMQESGTKPKGAQKKVIGNNKLQEKQETEAPNLASNFEEQKYEDRVERIYEDGKKEVKFTNGTRKEIFPDGKTYTIYYYNGDVRKVLADDTTVYYYAEAMTTQTTYSDGTEVVHFPNDQIEKYFPGGMKHILYADGSSKCIFPDGTEESVAVDGTTAITSPDGMQTITFTNGQREIHTKNYKRREYPDGTSKTLFADGRQETQYSNGRLRLKDANGKVIVDHTP